VLHRYWCVFSNGRRNSGAFYDIFHPRTPEADVWRKRQLDSRTVEGTDPAIYQKIIDKYGPDSDEARVEVYGQFPLEGDNQFISNGLADAARRRELRIDPGAPLIMGIDVARLGRDSTVIRFRQGWDARSDPPIKLHGMTMDKQEDIIAKLIDEYNPDGVCIDAGNNGSGLIDNCGGAATGSRKCGLAHPLAIKEQKKYDDKATELYGDMKDWLRRAAASTTTPSSSLTLRPGEKDGGQAGRSARARVKGRLQGKGL
jgi:hypothetical protein